MCKSKEKRESCSAGMELWRKVKRKNVREGDLCECSCAGEEEEAGSVRED